MISDERWDEMNGIVSENENGRSVSDEAKRLDSLPIVVDKVNLWKIDVEGYEKFVLSWGGENNSKNGLPIFRIQ